MLNPIVNFGIAAALSLAGVGTILLALLGRWKRWRVVLALAGVALGVAAAGVILTTPQPLRVARAISFIKPLPTPTPRPAPTKAPAGQTPAAIAPVAATGRIVFHSDRSGDFEIWAMDDNGENPVQLTTSPGRDIEPAWSPDGSKIVFSSARDDADNLELYVMNADGSDQHRLVEIQPGDELGPEWSPDGKQIVFYSNTEGKLQLFLVNADGTEAKNVSKYPQASNSRPSWSPDGKRIAFVTDRDMNNEIYAMNPDGSNQTRLTDNNSDDVMPKWSPDGKMIIFESNRKGMNTLFLMNADGSDVRTALAEPAGDASPGWSNGGARFYYSSLRPHTWEIFVHDMATGADRQITSVGRGYNRFPAWTAKK